MKAAAQYGSERVLLVHSSSPVLDLTEDGAAVHCFGPFDSLDEAERFDRQAQDACYKIAVPLVGPGMLDLLRSEGPSDNDRNN